MDNLWSNISLIQVNTDSIYSLKRAFYIKQFSKSHNLHLNFQNNYENLASIMVSYQGIPMAL